MTRQWICGACVGVTGMVLLCLAESSGNSTANGHAMVGLFLGLLAGFTYNFYSWSARRLMPAGVASRAAMDVTFGAYFTYACASDDGRPLLMAWNNAAIGIYMAMVPMFLGDVCYGYGLARIPTSMATTITLLGPDIAALLVILLVGERLPPLGWAGVGRLC